MGSVYHPPAFQFYPDDFVAGTAGFSVSEVGAYILLMCAAWAQGGVPRDMEKLARIARVSSKEMRKLWSTLEDKFEPHPTDASRVIQPRLEIVRAKAEEYARKQIENGRLGGRPKTQDKPKPFTDETQTEPKPFQNETQTVTQTVTQTEAKKSSPVSVLQLEPKGSGDSAVVVPLKVRRVPSDADMAAYAILDAVMPVIYENNQMGTTRKEWRQRNKRAALDLHELGHSPDDVVEMLRVAYEHPEARKFYSGITTLAKLQEHWPKLAAIDDAPEDQADIARRRMRGDFLRRV